MLRPIGVSSAALFFTFDRRWVNLAGRYAGGSPPSVMTRCAKWIRDADGAAAIDEASRMIRENDNLLEFAELCAKPRDLHLLRTRS